MWWMVIKMKKVKQADAWRSGISLSSNEAISAGDSGIGSWYPSRAGRDCVAGSHETAWSLAAVVPPLLPSDPGSSQALYTSLHMWLAPVKCFQSN